MIWIAFTVIIILVIDGVKMLCESFAKYRERRFRSDHRLVSAVIACYNEEKHIVSTITALSRIIPAENIIVVDDGSRDRTVDAITRCGLKVKVLSLVKNIGKVGAIKRALEEVKTPYVLLLDADIAPSENFLIPTSLLEEKSAVAFHIIPTKNPKNSFLSKLLVNLQTYEYEKSMQIGRKAADKIESVHCVSGAAGLFRTERLLKLGKYHSNIFPGEDLERTLIELAADGKVVFSDQIIETDVPKTIKKLFRQRTLGWWPGLWRNVPLFFKILFKKNIPVKLRFEMAYQLFSLISDPLKIFSLFSLIVQKNWAVLALVFGIYLTLETLVYSRMRKDNLGQSLIVLLIYPLYNLFQMFCRVAALAVFIWRRWIKREWRGVMTKIVISLLVVLHFLFAPFAAAEENSVKSQILFQHIVDSNGRIVENPAIFLGYKNRFYLEGDLGQGMERLSVGGYLNLGGLNLNPEIRIREYDLMPKIALEKKLFNPIVGRLSYAHSVAVKGAMDNFPVIGAGLDYYYGDYNRISVDAIKEFGRKYGMTAIVKNHLEKNGFWVDIGASLTNFGDPGVFSQIGYKIVFFEASHYKKYDFEKYDRTTVGAGIKIQF